jgi:hypothetical protein
VTGDGMRYGAFTLVLMCKYIGVYWAATRIEITQGRLRVLHIAAWVAFLWLSVTFFGSYTGVLDMRIFTAHLPVGSVTMRWGGARMMSTADVSHGGTSMAIMLIAGAIAATAGNRLSLVRSTVIVLVGSAVVFLCGSRQGLVRFAVFVIVLYARKAQTLLIGFPLIVAGIVIFGVSAGFESVLDTEMGQRAMERQSVILEDPFSNEGLSNRPTLWLGAIDILSKEPFRYLVGIGIGNYAEFRNAPHSMPLTMLLDGGLIGVTIITFSYGIIFQMLWRQRQQGWALVAVTAGMMTSFFTSAVFLPTLATGWYLGFYYLLTHLALREIAPSPTVARLPLAQPKSARIVSHISHFQPG